jgi:phytepsin
MLFSLTKYDVADTGSSDLWVISDACTQGCNGSAPPYTQSSLQSAGIPFSILYGDSAHGTFAAGLIGSDRVDLAGITLQNQSFAAVNRTNTSVTDFGAAGIFGIGFPINRCVFCRSACTQSERRIPSVIWSRLFTQRSGTAELSRRRELADDDISSLPPNANIPDMLYSSHNERHVFPSISDLIGASEDEPPSHHQTRQTGSSSRLAAVFASWSTIGPFIPRLVNRGELNRPMVTITLQRDTIDVGGNLGLLSIGELPAGVKPSDLHWVPLRGYSAAVGGIPAPPDSPLEVCFKFSLFTLEIRLSGRYILSRGKL